MDSVELEFGIRLPVEDEYDFGGIVRVVELLGCRENAGPPWHNGGAIGWVLGKPRRLPFRQIKGALGLFRPAS